MPILEHPTEWPGAIKGQLTRKVGPLPVWGWGAIIVGGIVAFRLVGKRGGSSKATVTNPVASAVAGGFAGNYGSGGGSGGGGGGGGYGGGSQPGSAPGNPDGASPGGASSNPIAGTSMDAVPGYTSVSTADQQYWASKVDPNGATVADTYDPATLLARWLMRAKAGTTGTSFTQQDINTGLAYATARASAAGVTQDQLNGAYANIQQYGDLAGMDPFSVALDKANRLIVGTTPKLQGDLITTAPTANQYTTAQISALNYITGLQGGWTPDNLQKVADMGYTAADLPALQAQGVTLANIKPKGSA